MTVTISSLTLPAASALVAVASDGTQNWQAILPGFDNSGTLAAVSKLAPAPVQSAPRLVVIAASALTRPANVTAYSQNDAVSNNATAGSVTPQSFTFSDLNDAPLILRGFTCDTTDTGVAGKSFRAWIWRSDPSASTGIVGGDNAAFSAKKAGFVARFVGTFFAFSDGCQAVLLPETGQDVIMLPTSGAKTIYSLSEALDAFTPSANSTTFTYTAYGFQGRL
jgi:hypothetical protein